MKDNTRAVIAYIVVRIVNGQDANFIYDYKERKDLSISGTVTHTSVNVYDYETGCSVSGEKNENGYNLYHNGNKRHINLIIKGNYFHGYDYDSQESFSGNVNNKFVSIYDYEHRSYFEYSL